MQEHVRVSDPSNKGNFPPERCLLCGHQESTWDAPSGPGLRLHAANAGAMGLILVGGRLHMPCGTTKK